jgi:hypothetical protein
MHSKDGKDTLHHRDCPVGQYPYPPDMCPCGRRDKYESEAGSYGYCIDCLHELPMAEIDEDEEVAIHGGAVRECGLHPPLEI